jgi:hypothetical protein
MPSFIGLYSLLRTSLSLAGLVSISSTFSTFFFEASCFHGHRMRFSSPRPVCPVPLVALNSGRISNKLIPTAPGAVLVRFPASPQTKGARSKPTLHLINAPSRLHGKAHRFQVSGLRKTYCVRTGSRGQATGIFSRPRI